VSPHERIECGDITREVLLDEECIIGGSVGHRRHGNWSNIVYPSR
jgi:hypothetical protein